MSPKIAMLREPHISPKVAILSPQISPKIEIFSAPHISPKIAILLLYRPKSQIFIVERVLLIFNGHFNLLPENTCFILISAPKTNQRFLLLENIVKITVMDSLESPLPFQLVGMSREEFEMELAEIYDIPSDQDYVCSNGSDNDLEETWSQ
ncbi:uncharacterized protein LOC115877231 [Sitophilus oryzae]|uniref:Uncharacterized protein LOC115877231 n=1 Tax=Sitophilus oryzae TaxID=7048 RepID=A0A6J2XEQ1_SITOR|nr:uncharacterized protein LOC115877231 [Sitophilus oryzae]